MPVTTRTPSPGEPAGHHRPRPRPVRPAPTAERIGDLLAHPVVSTDDAIDITNLSRSTIRRAIDSGDLPVRRIGRRVVIVTTDLLAWIGAAGEAA